MKAITNMNPSKKHLITLDDSKMTNDMNNFYLRFDTQDFSVDGYRELDSLHTIDNAPDRLWIDPLRVKRLFQCVPLRKAAGPDRITPFLLKTFAEELAIAWCPVFQQSLDTHTVPALWKRSVIIPLPKKVNPTENNDFRPVALTSVIMKCFEKPSTLGTMFLNIRMTLQFCAC